MKEKYITRDKKAELLVHLMAWAFATYVTYFAIGYFAIDRGLVQISLQTYHYIVALALVAQFIFFLVAYKKWFERIGYPLFVFLQILLGLSLITFFMAIVPDEVRSTLAYMSVLGVCFGVFSLNRSHFILVATIPTVCYGVIVGRDYLQGGLEIDPTIAVLEWVVLLIMIISMSYVGYVLTRIQERSRLKSKLLAESRQELMDAHQAILKQNLELGLAQRELKSALKQMSEKAVRDELTGLYNRHQFSETLHAQISVAKSAGWMLGVLIIDVDNFKHINDKYGHLAGDKILKSFAKLPKYCLRKNDFIARMGGEEFVVLLPNVDRITLLELAERLRMFVESMEFDDVERGLHITVSVGATLFRLREDPEEMIDRADQELYKAKERGRNQIAYHW